jgi:hypothetical protein
MTETDRETNQSDKPGLRTRFGHQSLSKKIATGLLAVAAALTTLWGAFQAVEGLLGIWSEASVKGTELNITPNLGLTFRQGGEQNNMFLDERTGTVRVSIKSEPFELRYPKEGLPKEERALRLVAWTNDSIFNVRPGTKLGNESLAYIRKHPEDLSSPFHDGKMLASEEYGLGTLILTNDAYNGVFGYGITSPSATEGKRTFVAVFNIENQERVLLTDWKEDIFLTVFIDLDMDKVMDRREYDRIVLDFEG